MTFHDHLFFAPLYDQQDRETADAIEFDIALASLLADDERIASMLSDLVPVREWADALDESFDWSALFALDAAGEYVHAALLPAGTLAALWSRVEDAAARA